VVQIDKILQDLIRQLEEILSEIRQLAVETGSNDDEGKPEDQWDIAAFFTSVRKDLFGGRLTQSQVSGMEAKLLEFRKAGWSRAWTAYALATSYHETARRMQPVREGLNASDSWRKKNLRYYPYYGRGDVQLTWHENYQKADQALGLGGKLLADLDLALDPSISAQIMVRGMSEGWFAGDSKGRHTLQRHLPLPESNSSGFKSARRIINGTDKADMIADQALMFQEALKKGQW
jgi:hypothetical protein